MTMNIGDLFYSVCGDECIAIIQKIENDDVFYTTNVQKTKGLIDLPKENFMANWKKEKQKPLLNAPIVELDK